MSDCSKLQDYLARFLGESERACFETHLGECPHCRQAVKDAEKIDASVNDWLDTISVPTVTDSNRSRLVDLAKQQQPPPPRMRRWIPIAAAAGLVIALFAWLLLGETVNTPATVAPTQKIASTETRILLDDGGTFTSASQARGELLEVPADGRLAVMAAGDRVEVTSASRAEIVNKGRNDARIRLHRGTVIVEAEKREETESLRVEAGDYVVEVIGTRFEVTLISETQVSVDVFEGTVAVLEPDGTRHEVGAGERIAFGAESESPEETVADSRPTSPQQARPNPTNDPKTAFSYEQAKQLILAGDCDSALSLLEPHLQGRPDDARAWQMTADCKRKKKQWDAAVDAYREVIQSGDPKMSNRARFKAAVLLQTQQGRHGEAATLFSAYRKREKPLRPLTAEAMYREADSLVKLGRTTDAVALLKELATTHAGTSAAIQARRLLQSIESE